MYPRKKLADMLSYLATDDIIVIHGARQTGKTSLMRLLMEQVKAEPVEYLDLEDSRHLELCEKGPDPLIAHLRQRGLAAKERRTFLFIDEIQYLTDPSPFLKLLHDHHPEIKLVVSGSSSFAIKSKFRDSLVGRTVNFELFPLDFEESLTFRDERFDLNAEVHDTPATDRLKTLFRDHVLCGGYPKIVLTPERSMRETYLDQIVSTYLRTDIADLAHIKDPGKFNRLLTVLATQSGGLLNIAELANTAQLARQTIEQYLFILENTYVIKLVPPFSGTVRKELFKTPKIFFLDTGLMHLVAKRRLPEEIEGNAFETAVFGELVKRFGAERIRFWRTQDKKEIDFILDLPEGPVPIEVKLNAARFNPTAMNYFVEHYRPKAAYCMHLEGKSAAKNSTVKFILPWRMGR